MTTPNYQLPYPAGTDIPMGAVQIRELAQAANAALTVIQERPFPPFFRANIVGPLALASGANALASFSVGVGSISYSLPTATAITSTRNAWHRFWCQLRGTPVSGSPVAGSFTQANLQAPTGTNQVDFARAGAGSTFLDVPGTGIVFLAAGATMGLLVVNQMGVAMNYTGGWIAFTPIDDTDT